MQIAILCAGDGWHVRDLKRAATEQHHDALAVDFRHLAARVGATPLTGFDGALVRTMPAGSLEQVIFRVDLLHRAQAGGVRVLNPPKALETCIDKYLTSARLAAAGFNVPRTIVCQHATAAMEAFGELGGDVVVKPLFGSEGRGMIRVSDPEIAWRTFQTLEWLQAILYVQAFVQHPGWDLRLFVLGGRVIAAMRRHAAGSWRTNVAQGGKAEVAHPGAEECNLAERAAATVGAMAAGVDLLPGPNGEWFVLEVNAVPGWRALARVAQVDIAAETVRYLAGEFDNG